MAGEVFIPGEEKVRPGVYIRTVSSGPQPPAILPQGVVAAVIRSEWGPLADPQTLEGEANVEQVFGPIADGSGRVAQEAFRGGAQRVVAVRQGTGGAKATVNLMEAAATRVSITAKHVGTRGNDFTVSRRASLTDATKNEILIHENGVRLETISYTPGADEAQAATDAVNAQSQYVDAAKLNAGDIDDTTNAALVGGTTTTVNGASLTAALATLDTEAFNVLVADVEDSTSNTTIAAHVAALRSNGKRVMATLAEPTSVAFDTRRTNSAALNDYPLTYVTNGFEWGGTEDLDGREAAGRVAGVIASAGLTESITHKVIVGATDLVGSLTGPQIEQALQAGQIVFTKNSAGQVQIEQGITTLVTPGVGVDAGWKKIRRVRTRDRLIDQIVADTDPLIGKVDNSPSGRAQLISAMQGAVNRMVAQGALLQGTVTEDPATPAAGDSAWFVIEVDDNDSAEHVYLTFGFRFAPPVAA